MSTPSTPEAKKKPWYKKWWIWAIVVIVIAAFASVTGDESEDTASDASSSETTSQVAEDAFGSCREVADAGLTEITDTHPQWNPALDADGDGIGCETAPTSEESEASEESEESSSGTVTSSAAAARPAPGLPQPHPLCEPNDTLAQMIPGVLNDQTQTVTNGHIITDGDDTWIGVTLVGADGRMDSRSDVWLMRDGALYAVSGGARNSSWAVQAPGVSMADEYAEGVDACVVAASMSQ